MKLNCKINQAEAIRRGFNANTDVCLDIDPITMSREDRDILASRFSNGSYDNPIGTFTATLNEPTLEGLMENIRMVREDTAKRKSDKEAKDLKDIAEAQEQFAARRAFSRSLYVIVPSDNTFNFSKSCFCNSDSGIAEYIEKTTRFVSQSDAYATEWKRLLATPEGVAWTAELNSENAAALDIAKHKAHAEYIGRQRRIAESKAEEEADKNALRQWSLTHGSETLRLRTEENIEWQCLAREEWADDAIRRAGIDTRVPDMDGFNNKQISVINPTAQEIKGLRRIREAIAKIPEAQAIVNLVAYRYTERNDDYHTDEPEVITRNEIAITIRGMHCDVVRYFWAK